MSLLEITGLTHTFGEGRLFKDAEMTLNKGEHIGIVGQNGAGKSTLIKICTEQLIPDAGRITWHPGLPLTAAEHLSVHRLSVGYHYPLLSDLDFSITGGQKTVITGFNGIGKSTLLKTLLGQIPAKKGSYTFSEQVKTGYFNRICSGQTALSLRSRLYLTRFPP